MSLTGQGNSAGYYSFEYYQNTSNSLLPMTGYLKPMELDSDGVWRRSTNLTSDDIEITDLNLYQTGSQNGQVFNEIDNLKVDDYVVQNRWQQSVQHRL